MPNPTYVAQPTLEIDGMPAPKELMEDILQISVEESLHLPGMFTLVIQNAYFPGSTQDKPWQHQDLFAIGKSIKINFSSSTTNAPEFENENQGSVLEGEITAMETHFTPGSQAPMIIRGYDVSHRLHRGLYNRSFQNMTDSDIAQKIAGEVGISTGTVDASGVPHDYVFQENQTNMEFLRERAARNGLELFAQDGKLNFRKPKIDESLELKWLRELHSFRVRVSSAQQVQEVEVRGWDYTQKQLIVEKATAETVITQTENGSGSQTSTSFKGKPPTPKMDGKVRQRTFQTRTGHKMKFVEEAKGVVKQGIEMLTKLGHQIIMNDTEECLKVRSCGNHQVIMDDLRRRIEIKTTKGHQICLDDAGNIVTIYSKGELKIEAEKDLRLLSKGGDIIVKSGRQAKIKLNHRST
jgi:hypothetical protein